MSGFATVSAKRLAELDGLGNIDVIDVRTPVEFRELRAVIARNVPLDSSAVMKERNGTANDPLYVICRSGNRSSKAREQFKRLPAAVLQKVFATGIVAVAIFTVSKTFV